MTGQPNMNKDVILTKILDRLHAALDAARAIGADMLAYTIEMAIEEAELVAKAKEK